MTEINMYHAALRMVKKQNLILEVKHGWWMQCFMYTAVIISIWSHSTCLSLN